MYILNKVNEYILKQFIFNHYPKYIYKYRIF